MSKYQITIAAEEANDLHNLPSETLGSRRFCIYVNLQGALHRFSWVKMGPGRRIVFQEQVTLNWDPHSKEHSNKMCVELWCRRPLFKDCIAVQWVDLDALALQCQVPQRLTLPGSFKGRRGTMVIVLTSLNFSAVRNGPSSGNEMVQPSSSPPLQSTISAPSSRCISPAQEYYNGGVRRTPPSAYFDPIVNPSPQVHNYPDENSHLSSGYRATGEQGPVQLPLPVYGDMMIGTPIVPSAYDVDGSSEPPHYTSDIQNNLPPPLYGYH